MSEWIGAALGVANLALLGVAVRTQWQIESRLSRDALDRALEERFGLDLRSAQTARTMAFLSACAYYDDAARVEQSVRAHFGANVVVVTVAFRRLASGAQYVAVRLTHELLVAVRGTNDVGDWMTNAAIVNLFAATADTPFGVGVHKGWMARANDIFADLLQLELIQIAGDAKESEQSSARDSNAASRSDRRRDALSRLVFGGHSMGGAVASILAVLVSERARCMAAVETVTFGAPPIGGSDVVQLTCLDNAQRFVRPGDVVPRSFWAGQTFVQHGFEVVIEAGRFRRTHTSSALGQQRAAGAGGALKSAMLLRALGAEPHSVVGHYRDIGRICEEMERFVVTNRNQDNRKLKAKL
jgi:hypothetical protein